MCDLRRLAILVAAFAFACGSRPYDWSMTQRALDHSLPNGTPQARVTAVLDSLAFAHGPLDPRDSTVIASKQEPHASKRLVFSTLRVVMKFSGDGNLLRRTASEVFTGP